MMDHNTDYYLKFLKLVVFLKLNYILCSPCRCVWKRAIVKEQLDELLGINELESPSSAASSPRSPAHSDLDGKEHKLQESGHIDSAKLETRTNDDGYGDKRITTNPMELSVITETKPKHANQESNTVTQFTKASQQANVVDTLQDISAKNNRI